MKKKLMAVVLIVLMLVTSQVYAASFCPHCFSEDITMYDVDIDVVMQPCGDFHVDCGPNGMDECWAFYTYRTEYWACNDNLCWYCWEVVTITSIVHTNNPVNLKP
ncbi:MAG: hypothetical protein JW903_01035 [Clostridia bacterium]|nr:hypothetical protein [Clostridia bacterium]